MATVLANPRIAWTDERRFFFGLSLAFAAVTVVGFAPTYYFVTWFNGTTTRGIADGMALTPAVHLHGLTGSAWMILLLAQTGLVAADRRDLHMKLGLAALPVGAAIAVTAWYVSIDAAQRANTPPGWTPPQFLLIQFGTLGGFVLFATLGFLWRRRSDYHKRLMMLATISMMVPVCGRVWVMLGGREFARGAVGGMILSDLFVAALVLYDLSTRKKLHPVTLWGGGALLAAQPLRVMLSGTETWQAIGRAIIG